MHFGVIARLFRQILASGHKAELLQEGIFFALNFLPWESLLVKKLEIEETKTTNFTTFKTDIIEVVLVFLISNFFANKNSQGRNADHEKSTNHCKFRFTYLKFLNPV